MKNCCKICRIETKTLNLRYNYKERKNRELILQTPSTKYHIKVDWETLQIISNFREQLPSSNGGPRPDFRSVHSLNAGGLQRAAGTQNLSIRSFIASFDVALTNRNGLSVPIFYILR